MLILMVGPEMSLPSIFDISKSSLVGLKAELAKKQEEVKKLKELQHNYVKPVDVSKEKKKTAKQKSNKGVEIRNQKDVQAFEVEDYDDLKKSREVLEAKSKLYDKLKETCEQNDHNSQYLIDFDLKNKIYPEAAGVDDGSNFKEESNHQIEEDEEEVYHSSDNNSDSENDWVDFVDTLGRSRRCLKKDLSEMEAKDAKLAASLHPPTPPPAPEVAPELLSWDMQREIMRQKWEEQEKVLLGKKDIHYQDVRFDEARPHGVGYFEFSIDESKRLAQQEELKNLRKETLEQQEAALGLRARRQQQLQARLAAARRRKRERLGLPPDEPDETVPEPTVTINNEDQQTEEQIEDIEEKIKRIAPVRPWDIGKPEANSVMSQEEWVEMKRQERPEEFAPPLILMETVDHNKKNLNFFTTKKEKYKPTLISDDNSEDQNIGTNVEDWHKATSEINESRQNEDVKSFGRTSDDNSKDQNIGLNVEDWHKATSEINEPRENEDVKSFGHTSDDNSKDQNIGPNAEDWHKTMNEINDTRQKEDVKESAYDDRQYHQQQNKESVGSDHTIEDNDRKSQRGIVCSKTKAKEKSLNFREQDWKETSERIDTLLSQVKADTYRDTVTKDGRNLVEDNSIVIRNKSEESCFEPAIRDWNKPIEKQNVISVEQSNRKCASEKQNIQSAGHTNNPTPFPFNSKVKSHCTMNYNVPSTYNMTNSKKINFEIMDGECVNNCSLASLSSSSSSIALSDSKNNARANKRKWAEIPPPPSMSYFTNDSTHRKQNNSSTVNIQESITVGMNYLKACNDEKGKKRVKGLLDII